MRWIWLFPVDLEFWFFLSTHQFVHHRCKAKAINMSKVVSILFYGASLYVVNASNEEINLQMIKSEQSGVNEEKVKILWLFCEFLLFKKQCMTFKSNANTFFIALYFHIFSSLMKMIYFYAIVIVFFLSFCFNGAFVIQSMSWWF